MPGEIVKSAELSNGERLEIEIRNGEIVIRRAMPHLTLGGLFAGKSADEWRAIYADAFDWGPDIGRETVEEWGLAATCQRPAI